MARKLASVKRIDQITPIEGADRIVVANLGGWLAVVARGEFAEGDHVVYFEPDSMLPLSNPAFAGAAGYGKNADNRFGEKCVILRTVRLRGQISQGLVISLDALGIDPSTPLDTDVSEQLGVTKYEPPETPMGGGWTGISAPSFVWHTDETRIQNLGEMLEWFDSTPGSDALAAQFHASEKIDGMSTSFYRVEDEDGVRYGVCSHSQEIVPAEVEPGSARSANTLWSNYERYDMQARLDALAAAHDGARCVVIQGETFGPAIQSNRLGVPSTELRVFNVTVDGERLDPVAEGLGDVAVPQLDLKLPLGFGRGVARMSADLLALSDGRKSQLAPDRLAEGVVWRFDGPLPKGFNEDWRHFKCVSNSYLAKEK